MITRVYDPQTGARLDVPADVPGTPVLVSSVGDLAVGDSPAWSDESAPVLDLSGNPIYTSLAEAEQAALEAATIVEDQGLKLGRICWAIKRSALWDGEVDPETGEPYESFGAYLKSLTRRLRAVHGASRATIYRKMREFAIYNQQLGYDLTDLARLGTHASILLQAARTVPNGMEVAEEDLELENGGRRLGEEAFRSLVDETLARLQPEHPAAPAWTLEHTEALVRQILRQPEIPKPELAMEVSQVGDRVRIKEVYVVLDGEVFRKGDEVEPDIFRVIARPFRVDGLPEGWR